MKVRAKTFESWIRANFSNSDLRDMIRHGVSSGFGGLTYYRDTCKLYDKFSDEIWNLLYDDAQNMGYNNVLKFIVECFRDSDISDEVDFKNLLVWYAVERIAQNIVGDE